jgi:hypothetical protein
MRAFLSNPNIDGTIFEPLRDPSVFSQGRVVLGVIQWPNGADLAPDAMYDAIRERGVWLLIEAVSQKGMVLGSHLLPVYRDVGP